MSKKGGAIVSATITLIIFTVLPLYLPSLIPPQFESMISEVGIDLESFTSQIATMGVIIAGITLVKGFMEKSSIGYLLMSIGSSVITLFIIMDSISLGDPESLGIATISMEISGGVNTAIIDMRLFVQLAVVGVVLQIVQSILDFRDARKEIKKPISKQIDYTTQRAPVDNSPSP